MKDCRACGRPLTQDERGLSLKLMGRNTTQCMCLTCLSEKYAVPEEKLREMIEGFRRAGCTLFSKQTT